MFSLEAKPQYPSLDSRVSNLIAQKLAIVALEEFGLNELLWFLCGKFRLRHNPKVSRVEYAFRGLIRTNALKFIGNKIQNWSDWTAQTASKK